MTMEFSSGHSSTKYMVIFVAFASILFHFFDTSKTTLIEQSNTRLLNWFQVHGGWISPYITLASFPEYGNGLLAIRGIGDFRVSKGDKMLVIPKSLQFSAETTLAKFRRYWPQGVDDLIQTIRTTFASPLEQQDVIIALDLMVQCSLGTASFHYPYLALLPMQVPRLDTCNDSELEALQDPDLVALACQSVSQLYDTWTNHLQKAVQYIASREAAEMNVLEPIDTSCLSLGSFHRFVAVASSHCMILDNTKYLVPMADMINHAPKEEATAVLDTFQQFHFRDPTSGDIHVRADRWVDAGEQMFEEYGKLDNSLYLMAFGFVPHNNPYHCALIPSDNLDRINDPDLMDVLAALQIKVENICVLKDGSLLDDSASDYLAVSYLSSDSEQLQRCKDALPSGDVEKMKDDCTHYSNREVAIQQGLRQAAKATLESAKTSLEIDLKLLEEIEQSPMQRQQFALAVRFRIADKVILHEISQRA